MGLFRRAQQARDAVRVTTPARLVGVFAGGTLGQKTVLVLGIGLIAFAVFKSIIWVAMALAGWLLCFFAVRDFERMQDP